MASSLLTNFVAFTKDNFDDEMINWLVNKDRPFLSKVKKGTGTGDAWILPVGIGNPQGAAADLVNAQAGSNQSGSGGNIQGARWVIPWGDYNAAVSIGDKVIDSSKDNAGAFFEDRKMEVDRLYETFGDVMETYLIGDAGHSVTPGTFTISTGVCTLVNPDDIVFIEKGMLLNASANDGTSSGHTLLGSGSTGYVIAINPNAGTFTVSTTSGGSAGTPAGWTSTMYAFRQGDFGGSGATRILLGYGAWIPASDPSATTFESVDRTTSITALSGVRLTTAELVGLNIEQRVKRLCTRMTGRGKGPGPTDVMLNPETWQTLADSVESRGIRPIDGKIAQFNYQKLQVAAGGKLVDVWANKYVPVKRIHAMNFEYMELRSLSGLPKVVNGDGLEMLRGSTSNNFEYRITAYPGFACRAAGYQGTTNAP